MLLAVLPHGSALAAVRSLNADLMLSSDRPGNDYYGVHSATFGHYAGTMSVPVTALTTGLANMVIHTTAVCYPPGAYAHDGWKQGLIAAFDTKSFYEHMILCAYRFASVKQAHAAYAVSAMPIRAALKVGQASHLPSIHVGDEVSGFSS